MTTVYLRLCFVGRFISGPAGRNPAYVFVSGVFFVDDIAELEDELVESARADEARFRAFRCFFVIEAFSAQQKVSG